MGFPSNSFCLILFESCLLSSFSKDGLYQDLPYPLVAHSRAIMDLLKDSRQYKQTLLMVFRLCLLFANVAFVESVIIQQLIIMHNIKNSSFMSQFIQSLSFHVMK